MRLVDIVGLHLEATSGAPLVLLREHDAPHRLLPIFVGGQEAASIAIGLSGEAPPRPLTHDVMAALLETVDAHVDAVEVTDLRDGSFHAELAISGPSGDSRLDTRPSDGIALAIRTGAPLFVSDAVLDEAGTVVPDEPDVPDEAAIDDQVAAFRSMLDEIDPADFALDAGDAGDDAATPDGTDDSPSDTPTSDGV